MYILNIQHNPRYSGSTSPAEYVPVSTLDNVNAVLKAIQQMMKQMSSEPVIRKNGEKIEFIIIEDDSDFIPNSKPKEIILTTVIVSYIPVEMTTVDIDMNIFND